MKHILLQLGLTAMLTLAGCQNADQKSIFRAQELLQQADSQINNHHLTVAQGLAGKALEIADILVKDRPTDADLRLLRGRACLTLFIAKNIVMLEQAPRQPRSLARLPAVRDFIDYNQLIPLAKADLSYALNDKINRITAAQAGLAHTLLGDICRLDIATAFDADAEYGKAIDSYRHEISLLKAAAAPDSPSAVVIMRLNNKIRDIALHQAEVRLLCENWQGALDLLEDLMGGDDLHYFSSQITLLNNRRTDLQGFLNMPPQSGSGVAASDALGQSLLSGKSMEGNPYQMALEQADLDLSATKRALVYRIISYYNLKDVDNYKSAREILHSFYPELDAEIGNQLEHTDAPISPGHPQN